MRTSIFSRSNYWTVGLVLIAGLFVNEVAWCQGRNGGGGGRDRRDGGGNRAPGMPKVDPASFFWALRDDKFVPTLKLTKEQEEQLKKIREENFSLFSRRLSPDEFTVATKELQEKAIGVLDDTQKATWEKRKQEILADVAKTDAAKRSDTGASGVARTEGSGANARGSIPDDKPPEGEIAVVSFGPNAIAKADKSYDGSDDAPGIFPTTNAANNTGLKEPANIQFAFRYAPWSDVLKLFAEINDLNIDLNEVPPGTFSYLDNHFYTMTGALDVLNGYLISKGYILVRRDQFLSCLNIADNPIPPNVVPNVTEEELQERGKNELVSLVLPVEGRDPEKMVTEVKELLGPYGKASSLKNASALVLTDIGSNLRRVVRLLKMSKFADAKDNDFRAIALKHISAAEAERTVRRLFNLNQIATVPQFGGRGGGNFGGGGGNFGGGGGNFGGGGGNFGGGNFGGGGFGGGGFGGGGFGGGGRGGNGFDGGGGGFGPGAGGPGGGGGFPQPQQNSPASPFAGKIQVTADTRTNHLLVTASSQLIKVVEDVVKSIDTTTGADGNSLPENESPRYLKGYSVVGSDVVAISRMLNGIVPGVVAGEDARTGKVFVWGTKEEHAQVEGLLKSTMSASDTVAVIPLTRSDPAQVSNTLRNLFVAEGTRAPSVEADQAGRRIIVRGTPDQLSQVRTILRDMKEIGAETIGGDGSEVVDRGNVRKIPMGNLDPNEILRLVEGTWAASGRSPIRVVIPSQPSPIRDRRIPSATNPLTAPPASDFEPRREPARTRSETRNDAPGRSYPQGPIDIRTRRELPNEATESTRATANAAAEDKPVTAKPPRTTQIIPRRVPVVEASQIKVEQPAKQDADVDKPAAENVPTRKTIKQPANDDLPTADVGDEPVTKSEKSTKSAEAKPDDKKSQIGVAIINGELVATSDDQKLLDEFEDMVTTFVSAIPQRTRWTVFYLRTADATEAAQMLERLFPQSSVTASPTGNDGLFGSLTSGLSTFGRGMMNATGLNQTLGGQNLRIITDTRANALFVTGSPEILRDVEYMLELLDTSELPGTMRDRLPRSIPVEYADIDEVADIIESVFKEQMTPDQPQQGGQGGFNPLAAMFGGGNRGGGNNQQRKPNQTELSLGVDKRTSHIIVSCSETMFQRVEAMVQAIDQRAKDANRTVKVMQLKTADPAIVQTTLASLIPKVTVGTTRSRSTRRSQDNQPGGGQQQRQNQAPDATRDQQVLQRMMQPQFGGGPGGFGGGGFQGGGFQGGRGGGNQFQGGGNFGGGNRGGGNFGGGQGGGARRGN